MKIGGSNETRRRQFLKLSALGAFSTLASPVLATHASQFESATNRKQTTRHEEETSSPPHRLQKLSLQTAAPLADMAAFYKDVLEMNVQLKEKLLVIDSGASQIAFTPAETGTKPYYHFAFNIPENKILSARTWLGERTKLAIMPQRSRTKGYPNEVMQFDSWNAHSLYFWDPAGNILELICRHDLNNGTKGEFRGNEILYASEIGFVTEDVDELAEQIKSNFQLSQYGGGGRTFRAIGDTTGLLILFKRGGTPIGALDGQTWKIFPTDVDIRSEVKLQSKTDPHTIKAS